MNATLVAAPFAGSSLVPIGTNFGDPVALRTRVVVGRLHSCDLPINDASVSREHARLSRLSGGYVLEDLGSTNGTLVNGRKIDDATLLHAGDTVTFGSVAFRYEEGSGLPGEETVPAPAEVESEGIQPEFPMNDSQSSLGALQTAAVAAWNMETPSQPTQQTQGDDHMSLVAPFAEDAPRADEVEEALEITARLSQLVQKLAERLEKSEADGETARLRAGHADNLQRAHAEVTDAIERAQPLVVDAQQLEQVRLAVRALAAAPRDIDVLRGVADRASDVLAVVDACASLQTLFEDLSGAVSSPASG